MAKPVQDVTKADIEQFLSTSSDFTFELRVLQHASGVGLHCRHGGTYDDPITQKARQFDIQAESVPVRPPDATFRFAIECKNLRPTFPLVVHRVPRASNEAFIDAICSSKPPNALGPYPYGERVRLAGARSPYEAGQPVGKAFDQIGKDKVGEVFAEDRDVFEKLTQALASGYDLIQTSHFAGREGLACGVVLPIVVVPDSMLWVVDYDANGNITSGPVTAAEASYFVGKHWFVSEAPGGRWYTLSHLELCTITHLQSWLRRWVTDARLTATAILQARLEQQQKSKTNPGTRETA